MKIVRTLPARRDMEGIWLFLAKRNPRAADQVLVDIDDRIDALHAFPDTGTPCEELAAELRRIVVGNYLIFYRKEGDTIYIVRVLHGNRNITAEMFEKSFFEKPS